MKRKTTFLISVLVGVILLSSALLVYVRAADQNSSHCASYLTDYLEKTDAYQDAMETLIRAKVATAKASPTGNVPPDWKEYEDEYDANSKDYLDKLKDGVSTHPNSPSNASGLVNGLSQAPSQLELMLVEKLALEAANAAKTAQEEAEKALANCTGQSIVTIYCERGADCQLASEASGNTNPKAHYVYDCPNDVEGALNINMDCPGEWWKCDGSNVCPRRSDHVVACKGGCGDMVGPDRVDNYHLVPCESNMAFIGCGQKYRSCNATDKAAHAFNGGRCAQLPKATKQACGHTYDPNSSSAHDHRYISSCSSSNANGSCTNSSGYYVCSPHTHNYPSPPPTTLCPANAWTNCGSTTSHATKCGVGHLYYTCNPEAVSAHESHTGCPADSWTNCGGWSSHAKECGRGHEYYTCNPAAVRAHSWH